MDIIPASTEMLVIVGAIHRWGAPSLPEHLSKEKETRVPKPKTTIFESMSETSIDWRMSAVCKTSGIGLTSSYSGTSLS